MLIVTPARRPSRIWTTSVVLASAIGLVPATPPATAIAATTKLPTTAPAGGSGACPHEQRKEHMRIAPVAAERDERVDGDESTSRLPASSCQCGLRSSRSGVVASTRSERRDDAGRPSRRRSTRAATPTRSRPAATSPGEPQRRDAVRGADRRAHDGGQADEREHVADTAELRPEADAEQELARDDGLERVPDADRRRLERRGAARRVRDQRADRDRRPEAAPEEDERCERDARRRPHGRDHAVLDREREPDLRRADVGGHDGEPEDDALPGRRERYVRVIGSKSRRGGSARIQRADAHVSRGKP